MRELEPEVRLRYAEHLRPVDQPVQMNDGRAVLDAGQLCLRDTNPTGDNFLRQGLAAVVGVATIGANDLAHVASDQGLPEGGVVPEASRYFGSLHDPVTFGDLARGAPPSGVVAGETGTAATTVRETDLRHDGDLTEIGPIYITGMYGRISVSRGYMI